MDYVVGFHATVGGVHGDINLMAMMKPIIRVTIGAVVACGSALADDKVLLGPHSGYATVISIVGLNSDEATVKFRRELEDEVEVCVREAPDDTDSRAIAACVKEGMATEASRIYTRRAYCSRLTLYTEFGNYSMISSKREDVNTTGGKPYTPVKTDWKDHRTGKVVGNCSACNTPQLIDTLKVLCPTKYNELFSGLEPY